MALPGDPGGVAEHMGAWKAAYGIPGIRRWIMFPWKHIRAAAKMRHERVEDSVFVGVVTRHHGAGLQRGARARRGSIPRSGPTRPSATAGTGTR
ncbi:hypothetical protein B1964_19875 [Gordonia sp. i37]|nr:hypothetical protein B1964_19875 [Gordonia sp. i37]